MSRAHSLGPTPDARAAIEAAVQRVFAPHLAPAGGERGWRRLARRWRHTLRRLRPLGGVSRDNALELFCDGDELFESMWSAIAAARRRVVLATYILEPDRVGFRTLAELTAAAARGVDVQLHLDAVGSLGLDDEEVGDLREAGGRVERFNPIPKLRARLSRWIVRDHRKILVVDGEIGFCGGMNVGEEYAGERYGTGEFRDAHLRIEGKAALDLEALLEPRPRRAARPAFELAPAGRRGGFVQVLDSNKWRKRRAIQRALCYTLSRARDRCWLTSPYFLPSRRVRRAITKAAQRGVDVRILTAGRSDVPIVRLAGRHVYGRFLRAGVRIFELRRRVLHAKTATIDRVYASVGSFNLDVLSDRHNLEVTVSTLDRELTRKLDGEFERDLAQSREVTLENWERRGLFARFLGWAVYKLSRLL